MLGSGKRLQSSSNSGLRLILPSQWNLDEALMVLRYDYASSNVVKGRDEVILKDFLRHLASNGIITGTLSLPLNVKYEVLDTSVVGMDFFDRLQEHGIVEKSGSLRGCYEENFHGIYVSLTNSLGIIPYGHCFD